MNRQVTYNFIPVVSHKDLFCHRGKSKLGIGPFIHELLREPLINLSASVDKIAPFLKENQQLLDADNA